MDLLKQKILAEGEVVSEGILRVDSFLNHQLDPALMKGIGAEFARLFRSDSVTKVLTVEASGIAVAVMTGLELGVPVVFAKKRKPSTLRGTAYTATVRSFTKDSDCSVTVSSEYIRPGDRVLIVDDFLANGHAATALAEMVAQAGAVTVGVGIVIEKGFQEGGRMLRDRGLRVESLAIVESLKGGTVRFRD